MPVTVFRTRLPQKGKARVIDVIGGAHDRYKAGGGSAVNIYQSPSSAVIGHPVENLAIGTASMIAALNP